MPAATPLSDLISDALVAEICRCRAAINSAKNLHEVRLDIKINPKTNKPKRVVSLIILEHDLDRHDDE